MKRSVTAIVLVVMLLGLVSCSGEQLSSVAREITQPDKVLELSDDPSDNAWSARNELKLEPEAIEPVILPENTEVKYIPDFKDAVKLTPDGIGVSDIFEAGRAWSAVIDEEGNTADRVVFIYDGTGGYSEKPLEAFAENTEHAITWKYDEKSHVLSFTVEGEQWSYSFYDQGGTVLLINTGIKQRSFKGPAFFIQDAGIVSGEPKGSVDGNISGFYVPVDDESKSILIHSDGTITVEKPAVKDGTLLWKLNGGKIYLASATVLGGEEETLPVIWEEYDFTWENGTISCEFFGSDLYFWGTEE